jgi:N-acetylmuramoyl-L-alanine amidase
MCVSGGGAHPNFTTVKRIKMSKPLHILLDPGHGGRDPGAVAGGIREADVNLRIAGRLWSMLEESGHQMTMTRACDKTVPLTRRVETERQYHFDLFVSIHCNASENPAARGMEIWTSPGKTRADAAATSIWNALKKVFGHVTPMRVGVSDGDADKESLFHVLTHTSCPAVLIECGFLTNDADRAFLIDPENQTDIADVIAAGIEDWRKNDAVLTP